MRADGSIGAGDVDADLLAAAVSDAEAFGEFYDRNAESVVGFFMRRTACPQTAADLSAETFAEALRTVHRFRQDRGAPRAWLFGIAKNQLRRFLRRRSTSDRALRRLGIDPGALDHSDLVSDSLDLSQLRNDVASSLDSLSSGVRDAVRLRVMEELSYAEVAARLGCSEGAARVRVTRGLSTLADNDRLRPYQPGERFDPAWEAGS